MAGKVKTKTGWQYVFKKAGVLEKPIYVTFHNEEEGDRYAARLDALLAQGVVPAELREEVKVYNIEQLVHAYEREATPSKKDAAMFGSILAQRGRSPLAAIDVKWVDAWIAEMKRINKLAPATIRAKVGAMARCADWGTRKGMLTMPDQPFRTLPDGYSQYSRADAAAAGTVRTDVERDRRLEPGEYERILAVIESGHLPRKREPLVFDKAAIRCMFVVAVESAMRLREIYTLDVGQVDLAKRTVFLEKTKNGDKRQVPITTVALAHLQRYLEEKNLQSRTELLLPYWDGSQSSLHRTTDKVSRLFVKIFEHAGCEDLGFHDLRHEAVSRLYERTTLPDTAIMKISGHRSIRMVMRYANLRGSSLASALW